MKDYSEFPPLRYFIRALKNCPQAAYLYVQLWKNKNKQMRVFTQKKEVRKEYLISPTVFRNLLAPLIFLNLVSMYEKDNEFVVDIAGVDAND